MKLFLLEKLKIYKYYIVQNARKEEENKIKLRSINTTYDDDDDGQCG